VDKPDGKRSVGKLKRKWENDIKMGLKQIE
jgi:hypothetical protein